MIKFLIYLLLFYVLFRLIFGRFTGSSVKTRVFRFDTHHHHYHTDKKEEEGRITINPKINKPAKGGDSGRIGDYIDYEEIK